jgi:mRNA interferase RelE/StbE
MKYQLFFTQNAKEDLLSLDKGAQRRIVDKLRFFMAGNQPLMHAKKLKNFRLGSYRFRVGDYRVIFDLEQNGKINILMVLRVKHRKEAYD